MGVVASIRLYAERRGFVDWMRGRWGWSAERRAGRVGWSAWFEGWRMRIMLKVERMRRSMWAGEDGFVVMEKQAR